MKYALEVFNALFNLLGWICAAGVLVFINTLALWYGFKAFDWARACVAERQRRREAKARAEYEAFVAATEAAMGPVYRFTIVIPDRPVETWRLAEQSIEDLCREALGDKEAAS